MDANGKKTELPQIFKRTSLFQFKNVKQLNLCHFHRAWRNFADINCIFQKFKCITHLTFKQCDLPHLNENNILTLRQTLPNVVGVAWIGTLGKTYLEAFGPQLQMSYVSVKSVDRKGAWSQVKQLYIKNPTYWNIVHIMPMTAKLHSLYLDFVTSPYTRHTIHRTITYLKSVEKLVINAYNGETSAVLDGILQGLQKISNNKLTMRYLDLYLYFRFSNITPDIQPIVQKLSNIALAFGEKRINFGLFCSLSMNRDQKRNKNTFHTATAQMRVDNPDCKISVSTTSHWHIVVNTPHPTPRREMSVRFV